MEPNKPITFEEIPQEKKSRKHVVSKILLGVLAAVLIIGRCTLKNKELTNLGMGTYYLLKASHAMSNYYANDSTLSDSTARHEVLRLLDKSLAYSDELWQGWAAKGMLILIDGKTDSACICLRKAIERMDEDVDPEKRSDIILVLTNTLQSNGEIKAALEWARLNAKECPKNEEARKTLRTCCSDYCKLVLDNNEQGEEYSPEQQVQIILTLAQTLSEDSLWREAVWVSRRGLNAFPNNTDLRTSLCENSCKYCDYLLEESDDTKEMWYHSRTIWNIDRKRGLNLRRKCARLGDQQAREWFRKKGYEWD